MASVPVGSQQRSTAAEHRTAEQGDRASHFANPLGNFAQPLLDASPSVVPSQSSAGDGEKIPEGAARRAVTAASSALTATGRAAKQGLDAAKRGADAVREFLKESGYVVDTLSNTKPSLIAGSSFDNEPWSGDARLNEPQRIALRYHINELIDFKTDFLEDTEPEIYSCEIRQYQETDNFFWRHELVIQHKKDGGFISIYLCRGVFKDWDWGIYKKLNGGLVKGRLGSFLRTEPWFGFFAWKNHTFKQEGEFQRVNVNGKEYDVLRSGTLRVKIRFGDGTPETTIVRTGKFSYSAQPKMGDFKNHPEALLSLVDGTKIVYRGFDGSIDRPIKISEETGTFVPLPGTDVLNREQLILITELPLAQGDANAQDPFLPFEDPFKPAQ